MVNRLIAVPRLLAPLTCLSDFLVFFSRFFAFFVVSDVRFLVLLVFILSILSIHVSFCIDEFINDVCVNVGVSDGHTRHDVTEKCP